MQKTIILMVTASTKIWFPKAVQIFNLDNTAFITEMSNSPPVTQLCTDPIDRVIDSEGKILRVKF